ncbi:uncharacterized protein GGS22DRAFT_165201 [Annulohypoxylon maeteangense]|uniref:uncharacterized protein n=1 Tax=Annulohypoxylon maeteangense TaxID=1927788 RepID=UPI002007992C|nr:uncharacterized protein GGS22DRAFT_165201 [Annulohypoxylon maeteangense]KAI0884243.1 hypothetical protein GGS22DRAFT_165201 [Annulohypoxylon maeteangense]
MSHHIRRTLRPLAHEASRTTPGIAEAIVSDFKIELLQATIPTSADIELPAKPIIFHERWEPAQRVNANLERNSKDNLISYRWLEEHVSKETRYILHGGKKIILAWRFLRGSRKFQTIHQIVHFDGVYALIFNHNRPAYSPHVSSLFEELLSSHIQSFPRDRLTPIRKWKLQALQKLKCYFEYLWILIGRQADTLEPYNGRVRMDYKDIRTPLGDLMRAEEDEDWVYVTLLDLGSNGSDYMASETPVQHDNIGGQPYEEMKVQNRTSALVQKPRPHEQGALSGRSHSLDARDRAEEESYKYKIDDNGFVLDHPNSPKPTVSTTRKGLVVVTRPIRVEPPTERLPRGILDLPAPEHHVQVSKRLQTIHLPSEAIEIMDISTSLRELKLAQFECGDLERRLGPHNAYCYPPKTTKGKSKSTPALREEYLQGSLSILNDKANNYSRPLEEPWTERSHSNQSESRSRFSWREMEPCITPPSFGDTAETSFYTNNKQTFLQDECANYSPRFELPPLDFHDDQDYSLRLSPVSTLSSESTEIRFPDDYWTWSVENNNYFHTESKPDGTKETKWYPRKFA